MTTKILIDNVGEFHIPNEQVSELLNFLNRISAVQNKASETYMREVIRNKYQGRELIED